MLQKPDKNDFNQIFQLLQDSFPVEEYRTYQEQKALLEQPEYQIYVYKHQPDTITALLAVWEFDTLVFVEHFAVDPIYRNHGIGGRMLDELLQRFEKRVCLEVEPPVDSITSGRVRFYERHGFFLNPYAYMQPAISKGKSAIPLLVMTYGDKVSREDFEAIKQKLYTRVYNKALT